MGTALLAIALAALLSTASAAAEGAPSGIAVDGEGSVVVSDYLGDRVLKFAPNGALLLQWGAHGNGPGQFSGPFGVSVDERNQVYVVDQLNGRVQRFAADGSLVGVFGTAGSAGGQLRTPFGVAGMSSMVYVADFGNDRVQAFTSDGVAVAAWGNRGSGDGQFTRPAGLAVDRLGVVYVSDHFNDRVQRFAADGHYIGQLGGPNAPGLEAALIPEGQLLRPQGLAVDRDGGLLVADYGRDRVVKFGADGRFQLAWGIRGSGPSEFIGPKGVAVDPQSGRVYVADTGNGRIQRFGPGGLFETAWPLP